MAEGILRHLAHEQGITVITDSAGTSDYHVGEAPDPRAQAAMVRQGMEIGDLRARQFRASDFTEFDIILAMDASNLSNMRALAPTAELEKALQTPMRESIQQKADEAGFARRANAVEKERVIKENELATELELSRRQEQLIEQQGRNRLMAVQREAESEKQKAQATIERQQLEAAGYVAQLQVRAEGEANARRVQDSAVLENEARRVELYRTAPNSVMFGFAAQTLATKLQNVQHLNITPDLVRDVFVQTLRDSGNGK